MKRLLGVLLLVIGIVITGYAKWYSFKPSNLKINIPSGWEVKKYDDYMEALSDNKDVILWLEYYADGYFGQYSWDEEYDFLQEQVEKLKEVTLEREEAYHDEINGMEVAIVRCNYYDEKYGGTAIVACIAIDTGEGLSMLTIDVVEDKLDDYAETLDDIIWSLEKI